ncbi:MAG: superfamily I DNA/RNA helicase [Saprospiraceae bacterium]|jgi:superfamily I DNA/RNA helicase
MTILFYDKFMDSYINLPKDIQKKVMTFTKKFRENSKSHAIHLEPISTFKDSSFRTARIDKTYRAIVRVPDSGNDYLLLWVDHHDKAMDWAKNKIFEWNRETQTYQIFTAPEGIAKEDTAATTQESNNFFTAFSEKELLKIGVPAILLPSILQIKSLDGLEKIETYLPPGLFEKLFDLFDGGDIQMIINEVEQGKLSSEIQEEQIQSANNRRHFVEATDDLLDEMLSGTLHKWKIFLHPSQRILVEQNFKSSAKVTGGAGTGKTVAALHRAKYLQDNDLGREGKPILFTTYTKSLTYNLREELSEMNIDSTVVKVQNIDAFAMDMAKKLKLIDTNIWLLDFRKGRKSVSVWEEVLDVELSGFDADFLNKEYQDVILFLNISSDKIYFKAPRKGRKRRISRKDKVEIWNLIQKYQEKKKELGLCNIGEVYNLLFNHYKGQPDKPFGHVIADEVQDFSNVHLRLLRSLVAEKPNDLFLVGDPLQKIYNQRVNFSKAGIHIRGKRSQRLKINYRTTEEIKRAAMAAIKNVSFDDFDGEVESKKGYVSLFHGERPEYQVFSGKGEELDWLFEQVNRYIYEAENPIQPEEMCIATRTKNGFKDIKSKLHRADIPYFDLGDNAGNKKGIRLSTFHNMKGLEFKVVILADVNNRTMPFHPSDYEQWDAAEQKMHDKREKALLYVAMTRAIQVLGISGTGRKSGVVEM